jgi:hypothetical protein
VIAALVLVESEMKCFPVIRRSIGDIEAPNYIDIIREWLDYFCKAQRVQGTAYQDVSSLLPLGSECLVVVDWCKKRKGIIPIGAAIIFERCCRVPLAVARIPYQPSHVFVEVWRFQDLAEFSKRISSIRDHDSANHERRAEFMEAARHPSTVGNVDMWAIVRRYGKDVRQQLGGQLIEGDREV